MSIEKWNEAGFEKLIPIFWFWKKKELGNWGHGKVLIIHLLRPRIRCFQSLCNRFQPRKGPYWEGRGNLRDVHCFIGFQPLRKILYFHSTNNPIDVPKSPFITDALRLRNQDRQTLDKILAVKIIPKNRPAFNSANNNMMQHSGCIQSCWAWHNSLIPLIRGGVNLLIYGRPYRFLMD